MKGLLHMSKYMGRHRRPRDARRQMSSERAALTPSDAVAPAVSLFAATPARTKPA